MASDRKHNCHAIAQHANVMKIRDRHIAKSAFDAALLCCAFIQYKNKPESVAETGLRLSSQCEKITAHCRGEWRHLPPALAEKPQALTCKLSVRLVA
jgi:hypothetical protein